MLVDAFLLPLLDSCTQFALNPWVLPRAFLCGIRAGASEFGADRLGSGPLSLIPCPSAPKMTAPNRIVCADNLDYLASLEDGSANLVYIDPPFNTGRRQERQRIKAVHDEEKGDRIGFSGRRYRTIALKKSGYSDAFDDFQAFIRPRLEEAHRLLGVVNIESTNGVFAVGVLEELCSSNDLSLIHI